MRLPAAELKTLRNSLGERPRVLYATATTDGYAAVLPDHWAVKLDGEWHIWPWRTVLTGRWSRETAKMHWELIDATKGYVALKQDDELPLAFRERLNASILVQRSIDIIPDDAFDADESELGKVLIAGRQNPESKGEVTWTAQAIGSTDLDDPKVQQFIVEQTRLLQEELGELPPDFASGADLVK